MMEQARFSLLWAGSILAAITGCSGPAIVESTANSVTLRYGAGGAEQAAELAQKSCAAHRKTARMRKTENFGLVERYTHFDCI